jgi:hypothetical protein
MGTQYVFIHMTMLPMRGPLTQVWIQTLVALTYGEVKPGNTKDGHLCTSFTATTKLTFHSFRQPSLHMDSKQARWSFGIQSAITLPYLETILPSLPMRGGTPYLTQKEPRFIKVSSVSMRVWTGGKFLFLK